MVQLLLLDLVGQQLGAALGGLQRNAALFGLMDLHDIACIGPALLPAQHERIQIILQLVQGFICGFVLGPVHVQFCADAAAHKVAVAQVGAHVGALVHVERGVQMLAQSCANIGNGFFQRSRSRSRSRIHCVQIRRSGGVNRRMQLADYSQVAVQGVQHLRRALAHHDQAVELFQVLELRQPGAPRVYCTIMIVN